MSPLFRFAAGLAVLVILAPVSHSFAQKEQMVDGIAAVVNSNVITFGQVRELLMFRQRSLGQQQMTDEMKEKMKASQEAAVKDLVDRQLIIDEFKTQGFQIPEYVVDDRMNSLIREEFGGDRTSFVRT
ncbi:MAG: SurA N-terminal domain-containing protein, partial [Chthoniobacterales bacterium]